MNTKWWQKKNVDSNKGTYENTCVVTVYQMLIECSDHAVYSQN